MRVAVIGATGAVGAAVVDALRSDPSKRVSAVVGIARRLPANPQPDVEWHAANLATGELAPHLRGVDALVNAARARSTAPPGKVRDDVELARCVLDTAAAADVHQVVQLSSFLSYSPPGANGEPLDETWPTAGLAQSPAARSAAHLERLLDEYGAEHEIIRLVRFRAGVALGPRVRQQLLARTGAFAGLLRLLQRAPVVPGLLSAGVPVVHHDDLAAAVRAAVTQPAFGAYNVALDTPLRLSDVASALSARPLAMPEGLVRGGAALADGVMERMPRHRELSASAWLGILAHSPRLDTRRARDGLEWTPRHPLDQTLRSTLVTA